MIYSDVVICGGGVAGVMAAVAAARGGTSAIVIERGGSLGGTMTASLVGFILDTYGKSGIFGEYISRLEEMRATGASTIFEAEKILLDDMCRESGVKVLFYTQLDRCETKDRMIKRVICHTYDTQIEIEGKIFIDGTGNGTLAALSGCQYEIGNSDGKTQPMSMPAVICGLANEDYVGWQKRDAFKALLDRIGVETTMGFPNMAALGGGLYTFSVNHEYGIKFDDIEGISDAVMHGRREIMNVVEKLKSCGDPAFENIRLVATPELIGIRESRRVKGLYTVTLDDIVNGRRHADRVCTVNYWVDIHALDPNGNKSFSGNEIKNQAYDIPFRAMLPVDRDNLILTGRCISGDFFAHASYRVVGNTGAVGEAAGRMAAESIRLGTEIKETAFIS